MCQMSAVMAPLMQHIQQTNETVLQTMQQVMTIALQKESEAAAELRNFVATWTELSKLNSK